MLEDGIYTGKVMHQRFAPKPHRFMYPLAMVLLDVKQLEKSIKKSRLWSLEAFNFISLYRGDYIQPLKQSCNGLDLYETVQERIRTTYNEAFSGTVKILTNPRFFGFVFNPVTFYLCYNQSGELAFILSEINNTPWGERHTYVHKINLTQGANPKGRFEFEFDKCFHVSPFMPMGLNYKWRFVFENEKVHIHMDLINQGKQQFVAVLQAKHNALNAQNMRLLPFKFPLQTVLIVWRIYWHAFRLWLKKVPFYAHPVESKEADEPQVQPPFLKKTKELTDHSINLTRSSSARTRLD